MDKQIAVFTGAMASVVSYLIDGIGLATTVLILMMLIDYITGLLVALTNKTLNSRIGFNGIVRKIYYLLLVASVYAIALVIPSIAYAGDGIAIALCVLELVSITENGVRMGVPVPQYVKNLLLIVKDKTNDKEKDSDNK